MQPADKTVYSIICNNMTKTSVCKISTTKVDVTTKIILVLSIVNNADNSPQCCRIANPTMRVSPCLFVLFSAQENVRVRPCLSVTKEKSPYCPYTSLKKKKTIRLNLAKKGEKADEGFLC